MAGTTSHDEGAAAGRPVTVLERDQQICAAVTEALQLDGYAVAAAASVTRARMLAARCELMMLGPAEGGLAASLALLRDIRASEVPGVNAAAPVVVFAAGEAEFISALRAQATLVVPHGASPQIASHAAARALQLRDVAATQVLHVGALTLDKGSNRVTVNGSDVALSPLQFDVLAALASAPGQVFSRSDLAREVYGSAEMGGSRALDVHVSRLGQRLRTAGADAEVHTVRGRGFTVRSEQEAGR